MGSAPGTLGEKCAYHQADSRECSREGDTPPPRIPTNIPVNTPGPPNGSWWTLPDPVGRREPPEGRGPAQRLAGPFCPPLLGRLRRGDRPPLSRIFSGTRRSVSKTVLGCRGGALAWPGQAAGEEWRPGGRPVRCLRCTQAGPQGRPWAPVALLAGQTSKVSLLLFGVFLLSHGCPKFQWTSKGTQRKGASGCPDSCRELETGPGTLGRAANCPVWLPPLAQGKTRIRG